jgi:multidrug resistance efflux pump
MTEVIHEVDSSSGGLMAVVLIVVIAIGGFLIWRFTTNGQTTGTTDTINVQVTPPAGGGSGSGY